MPVGNDNASALPISNSAYPICWSAWKPPADRSAAPAVDLGRVEEGLHDILRSLERQHASLVALADSNNRAPVDTAPSMDPGIVDLVKRELSDIRFSQSETDRRTQDSLETVHSTLGHVVDRLSTIEGDLRTVRTAPPAAPQSSLPPIEVREEAPRRDDAAADLAAAVEAGVAESRRAAG
jgi:localization factor PodJL